MCLRVSSFLEPVKFKGEGQYNLDTLKAIEVSESYLDLGKDIIGCQNEESFYNCTTKEFIHSLRELCGYLPLHIKILDHEANL